VADHDPLQELRSLLQAGEHQARPLPVEEVRARGTRRRRRRHAAVAGGVLAVALVVVGGGLLDSASRSSLDEPPVARSGAVTAAPSAVRTVTAANLIAGSDLPAPEGGGTVEEYRDNARPLDRVSVCLPDGLGDLGATAALARSYKEVYPDRPGLEGPLADAPSSYAVALQFPDAAAAAEARQTYEGWLDDCRAGRGAGADLEVLEQLGSDWTRVPAPGGKGEVAEVVYREPGSASQDAYWESTGLTLVGDRLMVTVHVFYGSESSFVLDATTTDGGFAHPQLGLVRAAAKRLAR
jgi:hypothetical protein